MDVYNLPSMALDSGFPAGMTVYLTFVYNDERRTGARRSQNQDSFYYSFRLKLVASLYITS